MKNKNASAGVFWMIVGAIIVGGLLIGLGKTVYDRFEGGTLSIDGLDPSSLVENCPDDSNTDLFVKLFDDYSATPGTAVADTTLYLENTVSGVIEETVTSATTWVKFNASCGKDSRYVVHAITNADTTGSARSETLIPIDDKQYVRLHTNILEELVFKVKDVTGDDWEFLFPDDKTASAQNESNAYVSLNKTNIYDTTAAGEIAVGTDGNIDLMFYVKTNSSKEFGNDKGKIGNGEVGDELESMGLTSFVCVDLGGATNGEEWDRDEFAFTVDNVAKANVKESMVDADSKAQVYIQKSEFCYDIGDISRSPDKVLRVSATAVSGSDPDSTDDDITLYFFPEGTYLSTDDQDQIKEGIYTDAGTQVAVVFTEVVPYAVIKVS